MEDLISRQAVCNIIDDIRDCISVEGYWAILERLKKLPSVKPQYTENEIQKMQDLEQAEIEKAYELGKAEGQESGDAISRQAVLGIYEEYIGATYFWQMRDDIRALPPVNPQPKTGHWIEVAKYLDGRHEIKCSECESHIFDRGHANSYVVKEKYKYCPRCGAKMVEPQERSGEE
jgi:Pyruvate/2-oxoacid:ferredoxin oxidoreductase delta subunit